MNRTPRLIFYGQFLNGRLTINPDQNSVCWRCDESRRLFSSERWITLRFTQTATNSYRVPPKCRSRTISGLHKMTGMMWTGVLTTSRNSTFLHYSRDGSNPLVECAKMITCTFSWPSSTVDSRYPHTESTRPNFQRWNTHKFLDKKGS